MKNMQGANWLAKQLQRVSPMIIYHRGKLQINILANFGRSVSQDSSYDFLLTSSELNFGNGIFEPEKGDVIEVKEKGPLNGALFVVSSFLWTDESEVMLRITAKCHP